MPRQKPTKKVESEDSADEQTDDSEEELEVGAPPQIEPYTVLGIDKTASEDEVKKAYRKKALLHHPDKAADHLKDEAHTKFQEIAFAYGVLSDPTRRARYDKTGSTSESIAGDDDFNWATYFEEQFKDIITPNAIEEFSKSYKGSDEEKDHVLTAYKQGKGNWNRIYEHVMLSNMLDDEDRFCEYIDQAIKDGEVEAYDKYTNETKQQKQRRRKAAEKEAEEAEEAKEELTKKKQKKNGGAKKDAGLDSLAAMIQSRQASRDGFFDNLAAKYATPEVTRKKAKAGKKGKREADFEEEPSEEAFLAARAKLEGNSRGERNAKRAKK